MSVRSPKTPSYRLHKPSGQAVVTLDGHDYYLGKHGSPESHAEYDRIVAEWLANGRRVARPCASAVNVYSRGAAPAPSDLTVGELILRYVRFADGYYVKDGEPTVEPGNIRLALRPVRRLYGHTPAAAFGPLALKACRQAMVVAANCRTEINRRVGRIVRMFKWGVSEELVPPSVHHALKAVAGLRKGRGEAREKPPVRPVPDAHVDAVLTHLPPQVRAMVELQRLTGMRPGEVCMMRTRDLDATGEVWTYTPGTHKAAHHGRERHVYLGPKAIAILKPWLRADRDAYLFSPRDVVAGHHAQRRKARRTRMTPSQRARKRKARPRKAPGERYDSGSYRHAIQSACAKAGVARWFPHQLRHSAATRLRREFGLEAARVILGHSGATTTLIYAEADEARGRAVMNQVG